MPRPGCAARDADTVDEAWMDITEAVAVRARVDAACDAEGRDPATLARSASCGSIRSLSPDSSASPQCYPCSITAE
jgi:hypothetical protein